MAMHVMTTDGIAGTNGSRRETSMPIAWLEEVAGKAAASWRWYQNYRQTTRELEKLSDKELDDIGVLRRDIPMIAMQSASAADKA